MAARAELVARGRRAATFGVVGVVGVNFRTTHTAFFTHFKFTRPKPNQK